MVLRWFLFLTIPVLHAQGERYSTVVMYKYSILLEQLLLIWC